jgi:LPS-assembly protein
LSGDLRDGTLRSARLVLDRRLQLAAREVARIGGRYTELSDTVASSCQVCAGNPVPLWEIRAARVVHDQQTRQIHFERAEFRVMGRPVLYIPRLRMPDPTVRRATGLLAPEFRSSRSLGAGVSIPYFIALAPDRDLTLTPRVTTRGSLTFGARYRQAFASGDLEISGALTRDRLRPGQWRGYAFAEGEFRLAPGVRLGFDLAGVSDRRYLDDYDVAPVSLLTSEIRLTRLQRESFSRARVTHFRSLDPGVSSASLPTRLGDLRQEQRFALPLIGGTGRVTVDALALQRRSNDPTPGVGRDLARASLRLDWRRDWVLPGGVLGAALAEVQLDRYAIRQDTSFPDSITRTTPAAAVELRWPWVGGQPGGARHVIEPVVQLVWAPNRITAVPNEDSVLNEFDEASLFALQRFSGADGREAGSRANLGLSWTRHDPAGWSLGVAAGRVIRARDLGQFSTLSGLAGRRSDWLAAVRLETADGVSLMGRTLIDSQGRMAKNELRLGLSTDRLDLGSTLVHLDADPAESRPAGTTEWNLDAAWRFTPNWTGLVDWRYDVAARQAASVGLGAQFRNECLAVDVSLSRRFASSTSVTARTDFGLTVDLIGFGSQPAGPARACAQPTARRTAQ